MADVVVELPSTGYESIIRSRARTFYLASLFLPARIRRDVQVVYAYCRTIDDLADEPPPGWGHQDILLALRAWQDGLHGENTRVNRLLSDLLCVARCHEIPLSYFGMLIEGATFDVTGGAIETRDDLRRYSVLMAGSVGMIMSRILGARHEPALSAASALGVAMQLTNVLRDVGEDFERGRVYLPACDLRLAGHPSTAFRTRTVSPALKSVMCDIMGEARALYAHGLSGLPYLHPSARYAIHLAATLYARILDKIEEQDFDVFSRRAHVGALEKWMLALPVYVQQRRYAPPPPTRSPM